ncbi:MAG TPA: ABC transporter ATP-binding protein, partial [Chloroflexota bacterium]|nr:ABC transporter ATP-binding protein [Chloroflexota bacterium]
MSARLSVQGIGKTFAGANHTATVALEALDLSAEAGEFVSIVGPSGCGKSTLLDIIAGLVTPSTGRVLMDGRPARLLGASAYMPQKDLLMPWRSVLDNTILGMEVAGVSRQQARRQARRAFARFGLAGFEHAWPYQLSGGMRQRVALLRTFLCGKDPLLLDEPFGALDAFTRREMQRWLLDMWSADRKTILFITHDVEEAIVLSDRIYVMSPRPGHMRDCIAV